MKLAPLTPGALGPDHYSLDGQAIPLHWRRHQRAKRLSLRLDVKRGGFAVTLPQGLSVREAMRFLDGQQNWMRSALRNLPEAQPFIDGADIPYLGSPHRITHQAGAKRGVWVDGEAICVSGKPEHLSRRLRDWLRTQAKTRMAALAHDKAAVAGRPIKRITVRDTTSRWGSCSSSGALSFSWRIIFAPDWVQDYLAAHEVAHLVHHNHGEQFWALVDELTVHRKLSQNWLKNEGQGLLRIGA